MHAIWNITLYFKINKIVEFNLHFQSCLSKIIFIHIDFKINFKTGHLKKKNEYILILNWPKL